MTSTCFTKGDVEHDVDCISIYTSHLFQRMHQRMGLDVSDRLAVIRNFATILEGAPIQINEPRNGRKHHEVCALLGDAAILVGGLYECKDKRKLIVYYKSFLPVKALTPQQRRFYKELLSKK
jgi:hypothetical protein